MHKNEYMTNGHTCSYNTQWIFIVDEGIRNSLVALCQRCVKRSKSCLFSMGTDGRGKERGDSRQKYVRFRGKLFNKSAQSASQR